MYKNILFYTMLIGAVTRLISAGMLAMMGKINLPVELVILSLIETLITGSVLSVLVSAALLFLTFRRKRYITIRQRREEQGEAAPSKTVSVPAKQ